MRQSTTPSAKSDPPTPRGSPIVHVRFPTDELAGLDAACALLHKDRSTFVRDAVAGAIRRVLAVPPVGPG